MVRTVLHVDDDPDIRTIVQLALSLDRTFASVAAASAEDALRLVADGLRPDVALLDVTMQGLDGPHLRERLHILVSPERLPVIYMTGRRRPAELATLRGPGVIGIIPKPFDPLTLAREIAALLVSGSSPGSGAGKTFPH